MVYQHRSRVSGPALREAFVDEALRVVEEKGAEVLSAAAVCRAVGATETASYSHFPDGVTELLAAVALRGFDRLLAALDGLSPTARGEDRIRDVFLTYVRFGLQFPNLYRAMFSPRLAVKLGAVNFAASGTARGAHTYEELMMKKAVAYDLFVSPTQALGRSSGTGATHVGDAEKAIATLAHGLVLEFIDEGIDAGTTTTERRMTTRLDTASRLLDMLLHGVIAGRSAGAEREV